LVLLLRQERYLYQCRKQEIPLQKFSPRILKKKIRSLREQGKIDFIEEAGSILFKIEHIIEIAKQLVKIQTK